MCILLFLGNEILPLEYTIMIGKLYFVHVAGLCALLEMLVFYPEVAGKKAHDASFTTASLVTSLPGCPNLDVGIAL